MERLLSDLTHACNTDSIEIVRNISLIAVVGLRMAGNKGTAAKLFGALANADVNIRMIDQGSSEISIIVGVDESELIPALEAIYTSFVTE
jgi:aspartate kinase